MIKFKVLVVALLLVVILAACGGDTDATATTEAGVLTPQARDTTGTPTPTPTLPIPTATPISAPGVEIPTPVSYAPGYDEVAYDYAATIVSELPDRHSATSGELAAAEFIAGEMESFGYETEIPSFGLRLIDESEPWLRITGEEEREVESLFLFRTGFGDAEGKLIHVGLGRPEDFPDEGIGGAVALIERGEIDFQVKATNAYEEGAVAAVIYNSEPENFAGTLQDPGDIPVLSISQEDGQSLLTMMEAGEVTVRVRVHTEERESRNVVATKRGSIAGIPGIVVGAHYDTDALSVGANDNASGTAVLLAVAQALRDDDLPADVTFVAFGSEKIGLLGSQRYVSDAVGEDIASVKLMINLDAVGSGERTIVAGDPAVQLETLRLATELGVTLSPGREPEGLISDHAVFQAVGIPAVFFFGDDPSRINTSEDTLEFINAELMGDMVNVVASLVRSLAIP